MTSKAAPALAAAYHHGITYFVTRPCLHTRYRGSSAFVSFDILAELGYTYLFHNDANTSLNNIQNSRGSSTILSFDINALLIAIVNTATEQTMR